MRAAGKSPIGDQRDILSESRAHHSRSRRQHLGHSWAAFGALVSDDDDVAFLDFLPLECMQHVLLGVVYLCGT